MTTPKPQLGAALNVNSDTTITDGSYILVDSTSNPVNITISSKREQSAGDQLMIIDVGGNAISNNIFVKNSGGTTIYTIKKNNELLNLAIINGNIYFTEAPSSGNFAQVLTASSTAAQILAAANTYETVDFGTNVVGVGLNYVSGFFTATEADVYHFDMNLFPSQTSGGISLVHYRVIYNKSTDNIAYRDFDSRIANANGPQNLSQSFSIYLNVGDNITIEMGQDTSVGAGLNAQLKGNPLPNLESPSYNSASAIMYVTRGSQ